MESLTLGLARERRSHTPGGNTSTYFSVTDWTAIKARKQQIICKNNRIENSKRIPHHYQVGDLVMLENNRANKYEQPYSRPYRITQVNRNGTVHLKINAVTDTVNI
jgi:hypothetical protein